jgi:hypothetical protein
MGRESISILHESVDTLWNMIYLFICFETASSKDGSESRWAFDFYPFVSVLITQPHHPVF